MLSYAVSVCFRSAACGLEEGFFSVLDSEGGSVAQAHRQRTLRTGLLAILGARMRARTLLGGRPSLLGTPFRPRLFVSFLFHIVLPSFQVSSPATVEGFNSFVRC